LRNRIFSHPSRRLPIKVAAQAKNSFLCSKGSLPFASDSAGSLPLLSLTSVQKVSTGVQQNRNVLAMMSVGFSFVDSFDCYLFRTIQEKERACSRTVKVLLVLFYGMLHESASQNRIFFLRFLRERTRVGWIFFEKGSMLLAVLFLLRRLYHQFVPDGGDIFIL
jgi:hypothetical protein